MSLESIICYVRYGDMFCKELELPTDGFLNALTKSLECGPVGRSK